MKISEKHLQHFCKNSSYFVKPYKLTNESQLKSAIENSSLSQGLSKKTPCIFNSDSLMNWLRMNERDVVYLDEAEKETCSYSELCDAEKRQYVSMFKNCEFVQMQLDKCFSMSAEHIENGIASLAYVEAIVDVDVCSTEKVVNLLSRRADLLGYSYVDHAVEVEKTNVEFNGKMFQCAKILVEFESAYVDSTISIGKYVYHVMSKQVVDKIFKTKTGLIAGNKNRFNFCYPSRVYCFVDRNDDLEKLYVSKAQKMSKKFIDQQDLLNDVKDYFVELNKKIGKGVLFDTREFCVLQIDTRKLVHTKFYRDNTFEINGRFLAVYTENNIPFSAIEKVAEFHL